MENKLSIEQFEDITNSLLSSWYRVAEGAQGFERDALEHLAWPSLGSIFKMPGSETERLLRFLLRQTKSSEPEWQTSINKQLETLNHRTLGHSRQIEYIEARLDSSDSRKGDQEDSVCLEGFVSIARHFEEIESQPEDKSKVLYHFMEMEVILQNLEKIATSLSKLYEMRLASTLKNICKIHEPSDLTTEQIKMFVVCARSFVEAWGSLTKEKVDYIRKILLEQKLTWLPVTNKAAQVIEKNRKGLNERAIS